MRTYVTSLSSQARLAHIGTSYWTSCGFIPVSSFLESNTVPRGRRVCPRCAAYQDRTTGRKDSPTRRAMYSRRVERENAILSDLRAGAHVRDIVRRRDISQRTVVRYMSRMRRRAGARTTFQWGYLVGLSERPERPADNGG